MIAGLLITRIYRTAVRLVRNVVGGVSSYNAVFLEGRSRLRRGLVFMPCPVARTREGRPSLDDQRLSRQTGRLRRGDRQVRSPMPTRRNATMRRSRRVVRAGVIEVQLESDGGAS